MGENATSYALVRPDGKVETFLRLDMPVGWEPEPGYALVPDDELPEGWERYEEPAPVPTTISPRQIRIWLITHGISIAVVEQAIASIPDETQRQIVQVEWEYSPYVERTHPWLEALGSALGLDSAAIDQAFREASVI
jgi:hypothetical protein